MTLIIVHDKEQDFTHLGCKEGGRVAKAAIVDVKFVILASVVEVTN
jgi:hypothetical protein